jgi:hypothetical protein
MTRFSTPGSSAQAKKRTNGVQTLGKVTVGRFEVPQAFYGDMVNAVPVYAEAIQRGTEDIPSRFEELFPNHNWMALAERCRAFGFLSNQPEFLPYYIAYEARFGHHKATLLRIAAKIPLVYGEEPDMGAALGELEYYGPQLEGMK